MKKAKDSEDESCSSTMKSKVQPGHMHTCVGNHMNKSHFCRDCKQWWGK